MLHTGIPRHLLRWRHVLGIVKGTQMHRTVILPTCMNSRSTTGREIYSASLPLHSPPSPTPSSICLWLCTGFLLCMGSSLRARILSPGFNLVGLPCPPAWAITARTENVLDKCLLNGYMNKTEKRKCHKSKHYKSATEIHRKDWLLLSGRTKVGVSVIKEGVVE